jgi:AraC-like DNA-binding protein
MIHMAEERLVESPYVEWVAHGYTVADDVAMRPAEYNWHLIFTRHEGILRTLVVGALEAARPLSYAAGVESLWLRFRVGTFMPHVPMPTMLNREITLPAGSGNTFWLKNQVWEIPNFENAGAFVEHLVRAGALTRDPLVEATLRDELPDISARTIRHRFQHSTGMRQTYIRQIERAQRAVERLRQGHSILDTAYELGYADQPHLTRSLKRFLGYSPRKLLISASQTA